MSFCDTIPWKHHDWFRREILALRDLRLSIMGLAFTDTSKIPRSVQPSPSDSLCRVRGRNVRFIAGDARSRRKRRRLDWTVVHFNLYRAESEAINQGFPTKLGAVAGTSAETDAPSAIHSENERLVPSDTVELSSKDIPPATEPYLSYLYEAVPWVDMYPIWLFRVLA